MTARGERSGDRGLLGLVFPDERGGDADGKLKRVSWETFDEEFEDKDLALVYPAGEPADATEAFELVQGDARGGRTDRNPPV